MESEFRERDPFAPVNYSYRDAVLLHEEQSAFQHIEVRKHPFFGLMLVLDGVLQLTERDEFFYHEMLVHPILHAHPSPRSILIVGGGDGGSVREVLKHPSVERVTLAELDEAVIRTSKSYFPTLSSGFDDPRVSILHGDGADVVQRSRDSFDAIIVDSTDPVGPARQLFSEHFYRQAFDALKEDGLLSCQSESLHFHRPFVAEVQQTLQRVFPIADCYTQALSTYAGNWWSFSVGSKRYDPRKPVPGKRIAARYYSRGVHRQAFLPRELHRLLLANQLDW